MTKNDRIWLFFMKLFAPTCHQKAERSFCIGEYQFPVCARCVGLYIGEILALILLISRIKLSVYINIIFMLIMFMDWFIQHKEIKASTNKRRLITGILGGLGIMGCITQIFAYIL